MKIAIMQPYFFPYIGYFQLIKAVDKFVFYDDVNFINRGWINRNQILINNSPKLITVHLRDVSQNKLINEVYIAGNIEKTKTSIYMAYKKAPFFEHSFPLIENVLNYKTEAISDLTIYSVKQVCEYLNIGTQFEVSSLSYPETRGMEKAERLKKICKFNNASHYINPIGGQELYKKEDFNKSNIKLSFIKTNFVQYKQFHNEFIAGLSIIDVLMFNSKKDVKRMLENYELH